MSDHATAEQEAEDALRYDPHAPAAEETAEYRAFVRAKRTREYPDLNAVWKLLNDRDRIEREIDKLNARLERPNSTDRDHRRIEVRIDELDARVAQIYEDLDHYPGEVQIAVCSARDEARRRNPNLP